MLFKAGKWLGLLLIGGALALVLCVEAVYRYGLRVLPADTRPANAQSGLALKRALWVQFRGPAVIEMLPDSPLRSLTTMIAPNSQAATKAPGADLAAYGARVLLRRADSKAVDANWRVNNWAATIWVSRHWSAEDVLNTILATGRYGHRLVGADAAARGYFNKPINELETPEAAMLVAILKAPTHHDPWCSTRRAVKTTNILLTRMINNWPTDYEQLVTLKQAPASLAKPPAEACLPPAPGKQKAGKQTMRFIRED